MYFANLSPEVHLTKHKVVCARTTPTCLDDLLDAVLDLLFECVYRTALVHDECRQRVIGRPFTSSALIEAAE